MEIATYSQDSIITETINPVIINISGAVLILLIGLMIGKLTSMFIKKILLEMQADKTVNKISPIKINITNIISLSLSIPIYAISFFLALNQLGIANIIINFLIILSTLVIIGSIILGLKDMPKNLIAGFKIRKKTIIGKKIRVGLVYGEVTSKNFLRVEMRTKTKDRIIIPNSYFEKNYRKLA